MDWKIEPLAPNLFRFTNTSGHKLVLVGFSPIGGTTINIKNSTDPHYLNGPLDSGASFDVSVVGGAAVLHAKIPGVRDIEFHFEAP
ncbi:hypothetical protein BJF89_13690 [Corynebacterium sp. CNJ-954]|uniref:hypothetical protein n=1 Tax=Corynebacterium sp. CNJ-954 TaxID=1904962 RepID=UPI00095E22E7|nr:hypothetical protein [Corynebacterium sp. CNJ-954]OLT55834.1 hypothetical protein BJF89_13690 [Corynebacterium sp. CNJ-954]